MALNSLRFLLLLLPGAAAGLVLLPVRYRVAFLLVTSLLFCALWSPESALLLVCLSVLDFFVAKRMGRAQPRRSRTPVAQHRGKKLLLLLSIVWNIGALALFKYAGFFAANAGALLHLLGMEVDIPALSFLLPIGISYYTFKRVSYMVDVYRGLEPTGDFWNFLLYVSFFPTLLAGPMDRAGAFLPQLASFSPSWERCMTGYGRILWGCAKKMIVADQAAVFVRIAYDHPEAQSWLTLVVATYLFAVQIYADFSGYCDMAIGAANVLGLRISENFALPYAAVSIGDFWRRWHITLSQWFRDYLYIPLGGNRVGTPRQSLNLLIIFLLSGLWHGAQWTFVAWGGLHGAFLILSLWTKTPRTAFTRAIGLTSRVRLSAILRVLLTFHLVTFTWIFFRASSLGDAVTIIKRIAGGILHLAPAPVPWNAAPFGIIITGTLVMVAAEAAMRGSDLGTFLWKKPLWLQCSTYVLLVLLILSFGYFQRNPFIYAQF